MSWQNLKQGNVPKLVCSGQNSSAFALFLSCALFCLHRHLPRQCSNRAPQKLHLFISWPIGLIFFSHLSWWDPESLRDFYNRLVHITWRSSTIYIFIRPVLWKFEPDWSISLGGVWPFSSSSDPSPESLSLIGPYHWGLHLTHPGSPSIPKARSLRSRLWSWLHESWFATNSTTYSWAKEVVSSVQRPWVEAARPIAPHRRTRRGARGVVTDEPMCQLDYDSHVKSSKVKLKCRTHYTAP